MFELAFSENASNNLPEELGHSQEDIRFLTKVTKDIRLTEGHYEIPLPFRQSEVDPAEQPTTSCQTSALAKVCDCVISTWCSGESV